MISSTACNFAKALVKLAKEKGSLEAIQVGAQQLALGLDQNEVKLFLNDPRIEASVKREFLGRLIDSDCPLELVNLLNMMVDRNYGSMLIATLQKTVDLAIEAQGYEIVTVISATTWSEPELVDFRNRLEQLWSTKIFMRRRENPDLLGGVVVLRGDRLYDGSVIGQLNLLRQTLLTEIDQIRG